MKNVRLSFRCCLDLVAGALGHHFVVSQLGNARMPFGNVRWLLRNCQGVLVQQYRVLMD